MKNAHDRDALHVVACHPLTNSQASECLAVVRDRAEYLESDSVANQLAAYAFMMDGHLDQAASHFDKAVRLDPHHADCWLMLGRIHEHWQERKKAIQFYKRAVVFERRSHEGAITLARLLARSGNLKDAIHTIRVCLIR